MANCMYDDFNHAGAWKKRRLRTYTYLLNLFVGVKATIFQIRSVLRDWLTTLDPHGMRRAWTSELVEAIVSGDADGTVKRIAHRYRHLLHK